MQQPGGGRAIGGRGQGQNLIGGFADLGDFRAQNVEQFLARIAGSGPDPGRFFVLVLVLVLVGGFRFLLRFGDAALSWRSAA